MKKPAVKMNARLEWRGRKLLANGRCIAKVRVTPGYARPWVLDTGLFPPEPCATEQGAKGRANRRFKLES